MVTSYSGLDYLFNQEIFIHDTVIQCVVISRNEVSALCMKWDRYIVRTSYEVKAPK